MPDAHEWQKLRLKHQIEIRQEKKNNQGQAPDKINDFVKDLIHAVL
jgi:hypothetical protein